MQADLLGSQFMKGRKWLYILSAVPLLLDGEYSMADDYFVIDDRQSSDMTSHAG